MKRIISILLALVMIMGMCISLSACGNSKDDYVGVWEIVDSSNYYCGDYIYIYMDGTGDYYVSYEHRGSFTWGVEDKYLVINEDDDVVKYTLSGNQLLDKQGNAYATKYSNDTSKDLPDPKYNNHTFDDYFNSNLSWDMTAAETEAFVRFVDYDSSKFLVEDSRICTDEFYIWLENGKISRLQRYGVYYEDIVMKYGEPDASNAHNGTNFTGRIYTWYGKLNGVNTILTVDETHSSYGSGSSLYLTPAE